MRGFPIDDVDNTPPCVIGSKWPSEKFSPQKATNISWFHDNFLITYYYSYASAMKQVPTNVPLHSLSSLSKADLSVYDSVDDQVLNDYAVSHLSNPFTVTQRFFLAIQHDRFDLCLDQGKLRF